MQSARRAGALHRARQITALDGPFFAKSSFNKWISKGAKACRGQTSDPLEKPLLELKRAAEANWTICS
jgi:hypothetical protein